MEHNDEKEKRLVNRSFSFSGSPVTQKISVEHIFQNKKGETLIRQYSCEQIYDQSDKPRVQFGKSAFLHSSDKLTKILVCQENNLPSTSLGEVFQPTITDHLVPDFVTGLERFPFTLGSKNLFNFSKICPEQEGFKKSLMYNKSNEEKIQEYTPMEVDASEEDYPMADVHSSKKQEEISDGEHKPKISRLRISPLFEKYHQLDKNSAELQKQRINIFSKCTKKLYILIIIPIICAVIIKQSNWFTTEDEDKNKFQTENIVNSLQDLLYGQLEAIEKIAKNLDNINDNKILVFSGGVGVGKTYASNIISSNFQWKDNIHKIISPQHKNTYYGSKLVRTLSSKGYNLIIVDNLEVDDISVISFGQELLNSEKKVLIILIYSIPEVPFELEDKVDVVAYSRELSDSLLKADIPHSLIIFNKLEADDVKKCIHHAMAKKGLIINEFDVENILQSVNYEYSGCKGVYTKVALLK